MQTVFNYFYLIDSCRIVCIFHRMNLMMLIIVADYVVSQVINTCRAWPDTSTRSALHLGHICQAVSLCNQNQTYLMLTAVTDWLLWWRCCCTPSPWGGVCLSAVILIMAVCPRKSDVPCTILDVCLRPKWAIWTYWTLFADLNTAVWTLSKTVCLSVCLFILGSTVLLDSFLTVDVGFKGQRVIKC